MAIGGWLPLNRRRGYVHLVEKGLMEYFGSISLCVAQADEWESHVHAEKRGILEKRYQPAADLGAVKSWSGSRKFIQITIIQREHIA